MRDITNRERQNAIFHYEDYDRMPVVHFGWWDDLLRQWCREGHLTQEEITGVSDGNAKDRAIAEKLGFDYNYFSTFQAKSGLGCLFPHFESKIIRELEDGGYHLQNGDGVIILQKPGAGSIPAEIDHTLKDRGSWETHFLPRLLWSEDRIDKPALEVIKEESKTRTEPLGIYLGSMMGQLRDWMGIVGLSYLLADDDELYDEILSTIAELQYRTAAYVLESGAEFDFGHFWEDIAFRNGPLVNPSVFYEKAGAHYKRMTDLCKRHGIDIISLDCDGVPDALIPAWFDNGVNTMFPIEVGVWDGSLAPWRKQYGKALRGVGGMRKHVLECDYSAIDKEIERLRPLVALGGYIPCPDHRLTVDTKWELVQYYCDRMKRQSW